MSKWTKNWFSNMEPLDKPFIYQDIDWHTVENFYQAMKTETREVELRRRISRMNPYEAKKFCSSRANNFTLRPDWDEIKLEVMEYALRHKFGPHTSWRKKLMETTEEIVEWNNWHDNFWGSCTCNRCTTRDGSDGYHGGTAWKSGQNHLGKLLMKLRGEFKE
jgi:ribA/ribD-fused uncharacterized protein